MLVFLYSHCHGNQTSEGRFRSVLVWFQCTGVCFQVFYPTLNINGKLFVAMDQNGVSPPPMQGQLPACTMEKVKEESVSMEQCV